jgi:hypothetical protein
VTDKLAKAEVRTSASGEKPSQDTVELVPVDDGCGLLTRLTAPRARPSGPARPARLLLAEPAHGVAAPAERAQPALTVFGDEVRERAQPACAGAGLGDVEPGAVRVERFDEITMPWARIEDTATTCVSRCPERPQRARRSRLARSATCPRSALVTTGRRGSP